MPELLDRFNFKSQHMKISFYQVDAFAKTVFEGNPAGVCILEEWIPKELMQQIAAENNLSETAFFVPFEEGYRIRYFTPKVEVDLCGHATLATAHVVFYRLSPEKNKIKFYANKETFFVHREEDFIRMDFPAVKSWADFEQIEMLEKALGAKIKKAVEADDLLVELENEASVKQVSPSFDQLARLPYRGVIITAPGEKVDFVSRFFAPGLGIDEDPVTGSAHTFLVPYWYQKTGKRKFEARQLSERGGQLFCSLDESSEIVAVKGTARTYLEGYVTTK